MRRTPLFTSGNPDESTLAPGQLVGEGARGIGRGCSDDDKDGDQIWQCGAADYIATVTIFGGPEVRQAGPAII